MTNITFLAYEYLEELRKDENYLLYLKLNKIIDEKYQKEVFDFNKEKEKYDEVLEYGRFHPDFKEASKKYMEAKQKLFEIDEIKKYFEIDHLIEEKINDFLNSITKEISENIPVFNKFGFVKKGGSCSGCK